MKEFRSGKGYQVIELFFPDPVIETAVIEEPAPLLKKSGLICCHCHKEIKGKVYNMGPLFFDRYCWSLRYIIEAQQMDRDRSMELRKRMEDMESR